MLDNYFMNGRGHGPIAEQLGALGGDLGRMRPFFGADGREYVTLNTGRRDNEGKPIYESVTIEEAKASGIKVATNATTILRKDEWIQFDNVVLQAARQRLRAWSDLAAASSFGGFDGYAASILEYEAASDPGEAFTDMDGLTEGRNDATEYQLEGLPLPITHSDFFVRDRQLAISRRMGNPLDTTQAANAGRRVAEQIEKYTIGSIDAFTYGKSTDYSRTSGVYGYINFSGRTTKTDLTTPTGSNGTAVLTDVLEMIELAYSNNFYGPFMLYHSTDYSQYMDNLFSTTEPSAGTLRNRLREIDDIQDVRRLDYLPSSTNPFTLILVQMTGETARAITGMPLTTLQWETKGGLQHNFKVMTIMVPQIREDFYGNCGIVHGTTS